MGKKHYSGKELIMRRQMERQQREQQERGTNNRLKMTLREANQIKKNIERAKKRMREEKGNGIVSD